MVLQPGEIYEQEKEIWAGKQNYPWFGEDEIPSPGAQNFRLGIEPSGRKIAWSNPVEVHILPPPERSPEEIALRKKKVELIIKINEARKENRFEEAKHWVIELKNLDPQDPVANNFKQAVQASEDVWIVSKKMKQRDGET